ncbi:hypothetical protein ABCR94_01460 [Streptomyces sp. 21So2-11]|uniref:hypothetical protein n=1 Tax=Streptomyces sp. 21So2-11 TaxID=3144408 RepID=UPI00321B52F2
MGIESDQLVYDFLSRVGDLAQQHQLPSGTRMRLVATLRDQIDHQRSKHGTDSPATVRRIIGRMGSPGELVQAAAAGTLPGPATKPVTLPEQRDKQSGRAGRVGRTRRIPGPRRTADTEEPVESTASSTAASPPHLAGTDELGPQGSEPDWWRVEPGPFGAGISVPGFVGGVEIPEILKPPPSQDDADEDEDSDTEGDEDDVTDEDDVPRRRRRVFRRRRVAVVTEAEVLRPRANVLLLTAAALLVAGAAIGNLIVLGGGWLLAYASRRISRAEAKWIVLGLPGLVATGGAVWLWGRFDGRWGEPIAKDAMGEALSGTWPVVLRAAAVASALYLVWRARRR